MRHFVAILGFMLAFSLEASALSSTSPFKDVDQVAEDLAQESYRAWRLHISQLAQNYTQKAISNGVVYQSAGMKGCEKFKNAAPRLQTVARIEFTTDQSPGRLLQDVHYRGCDGKLLLSERIESRGTTLVPMSIDDVLQGKRRFVRTKDETDRNFMVLDPGQGNLIDVHSAVNGQASSVKILIKNKPLVKFDSTPYGASGKNTRIELFDYSLAMSMNGKRFVSRSSGSSARMQVVDNGFVLLFRLGRDTQWAAQRTFEQLFSETIVEAMENTVASVFDMYISAMPEVAVAKPSVGANQRIKDELTQAITRLTTQTELDRVKLLLQSYLNDIESGELGINDKRPKQ